MKYVLCWSLVGWSVCTGWGQSRSQAEKTESEAPSATQTLDPTLVFGELSQYQNWPLGASAVSGAELDLVERKDAREISQLIPNLSHTDTGLRAFGDVISLRGLTNTPFFSAPSVVQYVDDVPLSNTNSYVNQLFATDKVEVFRGPQGAMFGRNSYGGVVNVISKQPTNEWQGNLGGGYGSYDLIEGDGYVMGPLIADRLFLKLGGGYSERNGYLYNDFLNTHPDSQRHWSVTGALTWKPAKRWDIRLTGSWDDFEDGVARITPLAGDPFRLSSNIHGKTNQETDTQALRVAYHGEKADFLSVTSRRSWTIDPYFFDLDFSPAPAADSLIEQDQLWYSQEFRWSSPKDSTPWEWTAGAFFSALDIDGGTLRHFVAPIPGGGFLPFTTTTDFEMEDDTFAVFGQLSYKGIERWGLHAGLRLEYAEKSILRDAVGLAGPVRRIDLEEDYFNVAPKIGVDYALTDKSLVYATTALAFKPGGFSAFVDNPARAEFDSEHAWTTEIGYKRSAFDDRLRVNTALFYSYVRDYQVERSLLGTDYVVLNADKAHVFGAELEFQAKVCDGLTIDGSVGYTHAELENFRDPVTGANLSGNRAPFVPELDASLAATYRHGSGAFARVELLYQGETYFDDVNRSEFREKGYTLINAAVGYENDSMQISVFGQNLADEVYYQNMSPDLRAGTVGAPARFGVRCRYLF